MGLFKYERNGSGFAELALFVSEHIYFLWLKGSLIEGFHFQQLKRKKILTFKLKLLLLVS